MRKKLATLLSIAALSSILVGCGNRTLLDLNYTYDRAIIQLPDGTVIDTKIKAWSDYDGEQLQIVAEDGTVYLTNSFRCDLIKEK